MLFLIHSKAVSGSCILPLFCTLLTDCLLLIDGCILASHLLSWSCGWGLFLWLSLHAIFTGAKCAFLISLYQNFQFYVSLSFLWLWVHAIFNLFCHWCQMCIRYIKISDSMYHYFSVASSACYFQPFKKTGRCPLVVGLCNLCQNLRQDHPKTSRLINRCHK